MTYTSTSAKVDSSAEKYCLAISVNKAVELSGLGRTFLFEAMRTGELASFKVGRRRLIRPHALEAWLERHEREGGEPNDDAAPPLGSPFARS